MLHQLLAVGKENSCTHGPGKPVGTDSATPCESDGDNWLHRNNSYLRRNKPPKKAVPAVDVPLVTPCESDGDNWLHRNDSYVWPNKQLENAVPDVDVPLVNVTPPTGPVGDRKSDGHPQTEPFDDGSDSEFWDPDDPHSDLDGNLTFLSTFLVHMFVFVNNIYNCSSKLTKA